MSQIDASESTPRIVTIDGPSSRARNLAHNRAVVIGRALPLIPRLENSAALLRARRAAETSTNDRDWLTENARFVDTHVRALRKLLPQVQRESLPVLSDGPLFGFPRILEVAVELIDECEGRFDLQHAERFIEDYQSVAPLSMAELWVLDTMLRLDLLERLSRGGRAEALIVSLKDVSSASWKDFFESASRTEQILREDPAGVYARMDFDTRDRYRHVVEDVARRSPHSEENVAHAAITLAREAVKRLSANDREAHVGYHLIDAGVGRLKGGLQYEPSLLGRVTSAILEWPTAFYLIGVEFTTLALAAYLLSFLPEHLGQLGLILFLLATEPAIAFMNAVTVFMISPRSLPKLDFAEGIPAEYSTMVVVPTLLLSEKFIAKLLNDLEVRFLANRDPALTFALLTDFPDASSPDGDEALAQSCAEGIRLLNERYASEGRAPFYLFHRRREWNPKQGTWMGWERKRGKLIALNNLLRGEEDAFNIKIGDLSLLPSIRYIITLDSDTELPRGSAEKLIGTMAHPLNRAVIDPATNTVREGYGILQPRVGISVDSARRSRLAAIYSGQTGFDIYTTAVSDIYQDLFGEGSYVGKGIYDVDVFQKTLTWRFPHDILLSHDLIEGTHARAGLVSDVELIDDYPSHYSAWSKRKHRWVRGDWQIIQWLLPSVPDYQGKWAPNPLSVISRWKILDNLRRSLIEIAVFVLLVAGWTILPGSPLYWTTVVTVISLLPVYIGFVFSLVRTPLSGQWAGHLRETLTGFVSGHFDVALRLIFLAHQTCLMLDAIVRSVIRTTVTGSRLLEWESAAQAEMGGNRRLGSVNSYLWLATPLSALLAAILWFGNPHALPAALPFLAAWFASPVVALWLNASLYSPKEAVGAEDRMFLRDVALRTWNYFLEFGGPRESWLIPDNVQEDGAVPARRVSPTNLGLLLNAQLAACDFGYLSQREFVERTGKIFGSLDRMERCRGHFYNWYDTQTLAPLSPRYVSTVDSGNLAAALITLRQGLIEQLKRPLLEESLVEVAADHCRALGEAGRGVADQILAGSPQRAADLLQWRTWLASAVAAAERATQSARSQPFSDEASFWVSRLATLLRSRLAELDVVAPGDTLEEFDAVPLLGDLPAIYDRLLARATGSRAQGLVQARERAVELLRRINGLSHRCSELVREMDFRFLLHTKRRLFHVGWTAETGQLDSFQYDLLASESRIASFVAIAKSDIPQENWIRLGRTLVPAGGRRVLLSWSGTMFEYLMPMLWIKNFPNSLLDETVRGAVACQRSYAGSRGVPWGISESACCERTEGPEYRYYAFGVPELGLKPGAHDRLVVAPYASALALMSHPKPATANLKAQAGRGWLARYGFYEAADFTASRNQESVVRSFMAHHQGMALVALDNTLNRGCMQERFHREPMVQATELLLHERLGRAVAVEKQPACVIGNSAEPIKKQSAA